MDMYINVNLLMQKLDSEIELSMQEKELARNEVERAHNNGEIQEANRIKSFIREHMKIRPFHALSGGNGDEV